ncbi:hypothetical protein [Legionella sp.]|uniref:hypothetical protein n=1 Tax=Legionella sp. TaxID=459 RepID=UPI003C9F3759
MDRLVLIAATGLLTLALTACGEHGNSKHPTVSNNAVQQQGAAPEPQPQQPQQPTPGQ